MEARHIFDRIQSGRYESTDDESQPSQRDGRAVLGSPSSDEDDSHFSYSRDYKSFLESSDEDLDKPEGQTEWDWNSDSDDGQLGAHGKMLMAEYDQKQTRKALDITELDDDDDNDFDDKKNLSEPRKAPRYQSDSGEESNEAPFSAMLNSEPTENREAAGALLESKDQTLSVQEFMDNGELSE